MPETKARGKNETRDRSAANAETVPESRFDDLWEMSDAEIDKGMKTLDLAQINREVALRRGR